MSTIYNLINLTRIKAPHAILLLFFPCVFGVLSAAENIKELNWLLWFLAGSILMRTSGCIVNDIFDRNIDKFVERTVSRPLAANTISLVSAIALLFVLLVLSSLLLLQLPKLAIILSIFSIPLIFMYPLMKRITYFPQVFLGFVYNIGVLIGYVSVANELNIGIFLSYIGCVFWTMGYDTIYGFADIKDDKKIGVKSMSIFLEKRSYKISILIFYLIFIILVITSNLLLGNISSVRGVLIMTLLLPFFIYQVLTLNIYESSSCIRLFRSNVYVGFVLSTSLFCLKFVVL